MHTKGRHRRRFRLPAECQVARSVVPPGRLYYPCLVLNTQKLPQFGPSIYNKGMSTLLTKDYIQSVIERENLVVRNLQVTQGYYRISNAMKKYVSSKNVNWTSFATHASKTAGQALRHELMPGLLKSSLLRMGGYENTFIFLNEGLGSVEPQLSEDQNSRLGGAFRHVSLLVSDGNITVFEELAIPIHSFYR